MRRVGTIVGAAQGLLVVRSPDDSYPRLGTDVIDESLNTVGTVVEIFGPVETPYLAVSPSGEQSAATLLATPVYAR